MFLIWSSSSVCQTRMAVLILFMLCFVGFFFSFLSALVILPAIFFTFICCPPGLCFIRCTPSLNYPQIYLFMLSGRSPFFPTFLLPPCLLLGCLDGLQRAIYAFLCPNPGSQCHQTNPIYYQKPWYKLKQGLTSSVPMPNLQRRLPLEKCCLRGAGWLSPCLSTI